MRRALCRPPFYDPIGEEYADRNLVAHTADYPEADSYREVTPLELEDRFTGT